MKKLLITTALIALGTSAHAEGTKILPVFDDEYTADFGVAVVVGSNDIIRGESRSITGGELSLTCPVLRIPGRPIRQQISFTSSEEDGIDISTLEINPHAMYAVNNKLAVGFGPSLGATKIEKGSDDDTVFGYGVGASARFNVSDKIFVGADARYHWTTDAELNGAEDNLDNFKAALKIGYQF